MSALDFRNMDKWKIASNRKPKLLQQRWVLNIDPKEKKMEVVKMIPIFILKTVQTMKINAH